MATTQEPQLRGFEQLLIGGRFVDPSSDIKIEVVNPFTEEVCARVASAQEADVDAAVAAAREAFDNGPWPRMSPGERAEYLLKLRDEVEKRLPEMQAAFTMDVGAPTGLSAAFHQMPMAMLEDAASLHKRFPLEDDERDWDGKRRARVVKEPVGVVATIIPWNGPVGNSCLKLGPALAAGCVCILKPAEEGLTSVMMLAEAIEAAGFPEGVVSVLPATREVGEYLVTHPGVDKVAFTGSTAAGRRIMSLCGERIRPVTLELGGKSAAIIADDIPLEDVLPTLVPAGIGHSGQVCAALTRILVPRERQEELIEGLREATSAWKTGDPSDPETVLGPLVAERQRDRVENYIKIGKEEGARLVIGGGRPEHLDHGYFVEPTVFADVTNSMRIAQEEIFGPVLVVIPFDSVEEAVEIANDSQYGLSGAVYAKDRELAEKLARRIRTGQVGINTWDMCIVQPFGGYKQSGLGREGGVEGFTPYLETKTLMSID
jgi:acyl-CoA reductase-like NAD-dependent aldehyde dehydrogenase